MERGHGLPGVTGRFAFEESNDRHLRLLRARRERPRRRRAAEQRDEIAPFHCPMPPVLRTEKIAHVGTEETAALRDFCAVSTAPLGAETSQAPILTTPQHF